MIQSRMTGVVPTGEPYENRLLSWCFIHKRDEGFTTGPARSEPVCNDANRDSPAFYAGERNAEGADSLWGFHQNRIAVSFEYEWHDADGQWYRSYGNELWEFDDQGLMRRRMASINDAPIAAEERRV